MFWPNHSCDKETCPRVHACDELQPLSWLSTLCIQGKRPVLSERYVHFFGFFLANMPPVEVLTTFYMGEAIDHSRRYRAQQPLPVYHTGPPLRRDWRPLWGVGLQS